MLSSVAATCYLLVACQRHVMFLPNYKILCCCSSSMIAHVHHVFAIFLSETGYQISICNRIEEIEKQIRREIQIQIETGNKSVACDHRLDQKMLFIATVASPSYDISSSPVCPTFGPLSLSLSPLFFVSVRMTRSVSLIISM